MTAQDVTTKYCFGCQTSLPLPAFAKNKTTKDGLQTNCKGCFNARYQREQPQRRLKAKEHYEQNKARIDRTNKEWRDAHKSEQSEYFKNRYLSQKDQLLLAAKQRYEANKETHAARCKDWRNRNKERLSEYFKRYERENPETHRTAKRNYKARKKQAPGSFTESQWLAKCEYFGWRCYLCGVPVTGETVHAEHRKPLSRGGSNWIANIAPACVPCNLSKNNKTEAEYRSV